jgi:hypothetical protein
MRVVVQRSLNAKCTVDRNITGQIDKGFMLLVGFTHTDTIDTIDKMVKKILNLKPNVVVVSVKGGAIAVYGEGLFLGSYVERDLTIKGKVEKMDGVININGRYYKTFR